MKRFCLALDLINDPALIAAYEEHHQNVWPEIKASILEAGIHNLEIYRVENRLFMIMDTADNFSFDRKAAMEAANAKVQEWEALMWQYQQSLPTASAGEKWVLMEKIFDLKKA